MLIFGLILGLTLILKCRYLRQKEKRVTFETLSFSVVPPGIEPFASVYSNSLSDCAFFALSFMKTIELALR